MSDFKFSRAKTFETRFSQALDKALFVVAFLVGCAGTLFAKFQGVDPFIISGGIIALMILYVGICSFTRVARVREDVIGDNAYYLGFLFTLVSLAFALWEVRNTDREELIEILLANFGIALSSTITGIFLRVFINQFRLDPVEVERDVRVELIDVSSRLKADLHAAIMQFNDLRTQMTQIVRESIEVSVTRQGEAMNAMGDAVAKQIEKLAERLTSDLDKPVEESKSALVNATTGLAEQSKQLTQELVTLAENMKSSSQTLVRAFTDAGRRVETSSKKYLARLDEADAGASKTLNSMRERVSSIADQVEALRVIAGSLSSAATVYAPHAGEESGAPIAVELSGPMVGQADHAPESEAESVLEPHREGDDRPPTLPTELPVAPGPQAPSERVAAKRPWYQFFSVTDDAT